MIDKKRQEYVDEMIRIKKAKESTTSIYLKRDYSKAYNRMKKELAEYDYYKAGGKSNGK